MQEEAYKKLLVIQQKLKAPKNQYNSFGKYKYRSCEDILEGVKPLLADLKCTLTLEDEVVGFQDYCYVKATASLFDTESGQSLKTSAYAREPATKKGMDDSQITGAASSYARKYALNGLFCIDDTKDADTDEYKQRQQQPQQQNNQNNQNQNNNYICCDCGNPFQGFMANDGKIWTPFELYQYARQTNPDGQPRCQECMRKKQNY